MSVNWKVVFAVGAGFVVLLAPCILHSWYRIPTYPSIKPWPSGTPNVGPLRPMVSEWKWKWLNYWYANSEDGVSGQEAWIWSQDAALKLEHYMPEPSCPRFIPQKAWTWFWDSLRAYCWSAWRNNANNLKRPLRKDSLNKAWTP